MKQKKIDNHHAYGENNNHERFTQYSSSLQY